MANGDAASAPDGHMQLPADWCGRLFYGGLGGLTLVLVRAIQLRFYFGESTTVFAVGWLTLLSFAIISMIWALVTDESKPMKVYLSGLGAPSLVAAFLAGSLQFPPGTTDGSQSGPPPQIPVLTSLFLPTLFAQEEQYPIEDVNFSRASRITDGVRASIVGQRPPSTNQYLYVIGTTTDEPRARTIAEQIRSALGKAYEDEEDPPSVHLLRPSGSGTIFVSIGHVQDTELAAATMRGNVLAAFLGSEDGSDETTQLLESGVVVGTVQAGTVAR